MSFHELLWTSAGGKPNAVVPQGPATYAVPSSAEDKSNFHNAVPPKNKDLSSLSQEYFQSPRAYHNPAHNGERGYTPHVGQELSMFPVTQVSKEDGNNYHRGLDKSRYKNNDNSFLNNSDFQSRYLSGSGEHAGNDVMTAYVDPTNPKASSFLASLSLNKSETSIPGYDGSDTQLGNQTATINNKSLDYVSSDSHMSEQIELNRNDCKQPNHGE